MKSRDEVLELVAATSMRTRVAIVNLCFCKSLAEAASDPRYVVLYEYYWSFVEMEFEQWSELRSSIEAFSVMDDPPDIPSRTFAIAEALDEIAYEYFYSASQSGVERTCRMTVELFTESFPGRVAAILDLCAVTDFEPAVFAEPHSRWRYFEIASNHNLFGSRPWLP